MDCGSHVLCTVKESHCYLDGCRDIHVCRRPANKLIMSLDRVKLEEVAEVYAVCKVPSHWQGGPRDDFIDLCRWVHVEKARKEP